MVPLVQEEPSSVTRLHMARQGGGETKGQSKVFYQLVTHVLN